MGTFDTDGFYEHAESDSAAPGGEFSALLNLPPEGDAIRQYVAAVMTAIATNPTDAVMAAAVTLTSSATRAALNQLYPQPFASAAARDTFFGVPGSAAARRALQDRGAQIYRTDTGLTEQYFAGLTDGGANPGGQTVAGWYQVAGVTAGGSSSAPAGSIINTASRAAPAGWLLCDGSAISRTTYATLFAATNELVGSFTITIATPGLATLTAHGLQTYQQVYLTTTGALPTGLSPNVGYWVIRVSANTFRLATSLANAIAGTSINTSGTQSGVHSVYTTFGVGNGSTTFALPDLRGRVVVGTDLTSTEFLAPGQTGGAKTHTLTADESGIQAHGHQFVGGSSAGVGSTDTPMRAAAGGDSSFRVGTVAQSGTYGSNTYPSGKAAINAHNNLQPYIAMNYVIKT